MAQKECLSQSASQTADIVKSALEKLKQKSLDAIAANPIFLDAKGSKLELAHRLFNFV